jgi:SAM-dependent methyltransferase
MQSETDMTPYFSGKKLYGDDFTLEQLRAWYDKEEEGYSSMGSSDRENYQYEYHALNKRLLFKHLPARTFDNILGFGSAYGDELLPILHRVKNITILEPSGLLTNKDLNGIPLKYVKPTISGDMIFQDSEFDLIISSAALHHVANVSKIINEFYRCLKPGGFVLIRVTQGDWRSPRRGLTPCERGVPIELFDDMIKKAGFKIYKRTKYDFPLTKRLKVLSNKPVYNSDLAVTIDQLFTFLFRWNSHYHPTKAWQKLQPASVAYVLTK